MGDRGQVYIHDGDKEPGVWLYTHWGASELAADVADALAKRWRWDDWEYLARIIFERMLKGNEHTETGLGIGTSRHDDVERVVEVDCATKRVHVDDIFDGTFEQFLTFVELIP